MNNIRKIKKTMRELKQRTDVEFAAFLGNLSGTVKADDNYNVYVTLLDGQVKTVRNQRVPNVPRLPVIIGYAAEDKKILQVLRSRPAFTGTEYADVPDHARNHEWGSVDPLWVRGEQFIPGLVVPNTGLTVRLFGMIYYLNGWHLLNTQDVDLSANLPSSGARYVLAEVDDAGTVSLRDGSDVASRGALTYADIPAPVVEKKSLFAVATYAGQTAVVKNLVESDIVDLRFGGDPTGAIEWDVILNKPDIFASTEIQGVHAHATFRWIADGAATTFDLPDFAREMIGVYDNSLRMDVMDVSLLNGEQIVFETAPTSGHVLLADYIMEMI